MKAIYDYEALYAPVVANKTCYRKNIDPRDHDLTAHLCAEQADEEDRKGYEGNSRAICEPLSTCKRLCDTIGDTVCSGVEFQIGQDVCYLSTTECTDDGRTKNSKGWDSYPRAER